MTNQRTLIALGASIEALPILRKIKDLGHRLIVVDGNPDAPGFHLAARGAVASCYSPAETVNALKSLDEKIDGVLCAAIDAPHVAAAVAEAFDLPGLTVAQAALGADKVNQIEALARAGIPVPDFTATYYGSVTLPTGETIPLDLNPDSVIKMGKVVIKPADSRGARGVITITPKTDSEVFDACDFARKHSTSGRLIAEKWLDGPQLSTESLVQDGKVLFTAIGLRNYARLDEFSPYCIEDGFDSPYHVQGVGALIEQSCAALDWYQTGGGVVKGDLVINNGRLHVIELAPRLSGGLFCAAHYMAYGVHFIGAAVSMALGERIEPPAPYMRHFVSQRYLFPDKTDIGKRIVAQEERDYGAQFSHYSKPIGHVVAPVTSHADRLGQALCIGQTPREAQAMAERTVAEMKAQMVIE